MREFDQRERERIQIDRRPVAVTPQQPIDARALHHVSGQQRIEWRQSQSAVGELLDGHTPLAEQHDWTELGVINDADDQLELAIALGHRFDRDTAQTRLRPHPVDILEHRRGCLANRLRGLEVQGNPAHI